MHTVPRKSVQFSIRIAKFLSIFTLRVSGFIFHFSLLAFHLNKLSLIHCKYKHFI